MNIILIIFLSVFFAGCESLVPNARDITPFRFFPDMIVQGCTVETYVSVDGKTTDGHLYHRIGKVFIFPSPEKWDLAFNSRFNMVTSALTGITGKNWIGEKDTVMATVLPDQAVGWRAFLFSELKPGVRFISTGIGGRDPKEVAKKVAILLQTGKDLGSCPSIQFK